MASIRIETATDMASGLVYAEIFKDDAAQSILRSEPAFASEEALIEQVLKMCREHFPDHAPVADDPTIGV